MVSSPYLKDLLAAVSAPDVLRALARAVWAEDHDGDGDSCPREAIPKVPAFVDAPAVTREVGEDAGARFDVLIDASRGSANVIGADVIGDFEAILGGAVFRLPVRILMLAGGKEGGLLSTPESKAPAKPVAAFCGFPLPVTAPKAPMDEGTVDVSFGEGGMPAIPARALGIKEPIFGFSIADSEPSTKPGEVRIGYVAVGIGGASYSSFRELVIGAVHAWWKEARAGDSSVPHPLAPLVRAWQKGRALPATPFRPKRRGSLARFERSTVEEARLLADRKTVAPGQLEMLRTDDVVDSCPTWLLGMFRRAVSVRTGRELGSTRGGMPWSFTLAIGGVAHFAIEDRRVLAPFGRDLYFEIDEIIGWLHPGGWGNRSRDWPRLDAAFEETPSYRVTVGNTRYSVVSAFGLPAVYAPKAEVTLNVRVPPSAAHGARFDWHRYRVTYSKHAPLQRALLATAGLLDRTASKGTPLTRLVREPVLDADGKPKRERILGRNGEPKRDKDGRYRTRPVYTGELVPNPLLGSIQPAILPDKHLALFLGMDNSRSNRRDARAALEKLNGDNVIDLERVPNGYRIFGPVPKAP